MSKLRLNYVYAGTEQNWEGNEILSCSVVNQCDPTGLTMPASVLECEIKTSNSVVFDEKAAILVYFDEVLIGKYYICEADSTIGKTMKIKAYDCIYYIQKSEHSTVIDFPINNRIPTEIAVYGMTGYSLSAYINACFEPGSYLDVLRGMFVKTFVQGGWSNSSISPVHYSLAVTSDGTTGFSFKRESTTTKTIPLDRTYRGATIVKSPKCYLTTVKYNTYPKNSTTNLSNKFATTYNGYGGAETKTSRYQIALDSSFAKPDGEKRDVTIKAIDEVGNYAEYLTELANSKTWKGDILWDGERLMDMVKVYDDNETAFTGHIVKMKFTFSANTAKCGLEVTYPRYYVPAVKVQGSGSIPNPIDRVMINNEQVKPTGGAISLNVPNVINKSANVQPSLFTQRSSAYDGIYGYQANVPITGMTSSHYPVVAFSAKEAVSGIFAPMCSSYDGGVTLYSKSVPSSGFYIYVLASLEGSNAYGGLNQ